MFTSIRHWWRYAATAVGRRLDETADPAVQVDQAIAEARDQHRRLTEQAAEETTGTGKIGCQAIERRDRALLRGVGLQLIGGNQSVVSDPYGSGHLDDGPLARFTFFKVPLKL